MRTVYETGVVEARPDPGAVGLGLFSLFTFVGAVGLGIYALRRAALVEERERLTQTNQRAKVIELQINNRGSDRYGDWLPQLIPKTHQVKGPDGTMWYQHPILVNDKIVHMWAIGTDCLHMEFEHRDYRFIGSIKFDKIEGDICVGIRRG